ncbi:hypothetical protein HAX54_053017 [Datura stramonium]|uniref:Uncharacterized protein n=1 Tax=Datura stramonium TaxID=4076 RepID=A0ABS8WT17_DATST|nr:hypothetical protein [Datura stramonium]
MEVWWCCCSSGGEEGGVAVLGISVEEDGVVWEVLLLGCWRKPGEEKREVRRPGSRSSEGKEKMRSEVLSEVFDRSFPVTAKADGGLMGRRSGRCSGARDR